MSIEIRIKELRNKLGVSQTEMAAIAGVTVQTLHRYEKGERSPDWKVIKNIVEKTKVNPYWLLLGEGEIENKNDGLFKRHNQMDIIRAAFPETKIDDTFMDIYNVLKNPELADVMVHEFAITLKFAKNRYQELFMESDKKGEIENKEVTVGVKK